MMHLLVLRENIMKLYQKHKILMQPIIKFALSFVIFLVISWQIGYYESLNNIFLILGMSVICAVTPDFTIILFSSGYAVLHILSVSMVLAVSVGLVLIIIFLLYGRYAVQQCYVLLAFPILYAINIPYVIPIILGLFFTPVVLPSLVFGTLLSYLFITIIEVISKMSGSTSADYLILYNNVIDGLFNNKNMLYSFIIFILMFFTTYIIKKRKIDHASQISIVVATIVCLICNLIENLILDNSNNILISISGIIISGIVAYFIQFFRLTLDYAGAKTVQFEDDEYYYYVKAIPKISITVPEKKVKRINAQKVTDNTVNLQDAIQRAYSLNEDYRESINDDDEDEEEDSKNI